MNMMPALPADAVIEKEGRAITSSLTVAEVFNKEHYRVLRAINNIDCPVEFARANFGGGYYADKNGQMRPMVEMTKDGFYFLVMGFTGKEAAQVKVAWIRRFNQMEAALLDKAFTPAVAPKVELDAMEYQQQQADYWRTKYELERLQREKAEAEKKRRRAFTEREKTIMLAMNARGKAPGQIAAEIGRTASSVRTWLRTRT